MTEPVRATVTVPTSQERAFTAFVHEFASWWPSAYTWAGEVLDTIAIEGQIGGLCYERGPHGFECDWGRVMAYSPPERLVILWQISPRREPVPNPEKASEVEVVFTAESGNTRVELEHRGFENHGDGAAEYRAAMASGEGWPYILERFRAYMRTGPGTEGHDQQKNAAGEHTFVELVIEGSDPETEIWLSDEHGYFVDKATGSLRSRLLRGDYVVEFGLGTRCYPLRLQDHCHTTQSAIEQGPSCERPRPGDGGTHS